MTILLNNHGYDNESWRREISSQLPGLPVKVFGEPIDPKEVVYAMVWNHPAGDLNRYPNLKAIFSLGAGAEHFVADASLPDVPVILLADPAVARDMAAHALYWVLTFHRRYADYRSQQKDRIWHRKQIVPTREFRAGVFGLGRIGTEVASRIRDFGYAVSGWDRSARQIEGVNCYFGTDPLPEFLSRIDIVINALPLSPKTRHFLDEKIFSAMPPGSFFVNISRGAVVHDESLLDALDRGHLAGAALDAFAQEPLPPEHRYWTHPQVYITPHMSGATFASSAVAVIANNVRRLERGLDVFPLFNREAGY
ncbi:glyoxylate/hydroxypyruvate reductase A [Mesorhizobium sp. M7A.F.Ce.TU.012.03.2.1]|uniref:2-hydroxyacid dehydrogenase n=1 Tax=Mesorhizobium sp. M7A.F.Ce.TU.012.03.2.1 TaxID=2493681 RepID=UPI000FD902B4|nr:glyoxylate/hydroxypyruvate reductase A [Mesorhizobium sp. M7A.F.Ce.TU.012.03.2.1]AZV19298.1 glyoxylate/hydroxypyruvate reductase A [Mesorhizobium sp. M7A.F.Ce.TU.012.03.2.1]